MKSSPSRMALRAVDRLSAILFGAANRRDDRDDDDDDDDDLPRPNATVSWRTGLVMTAALAV